MYKFKILLAISFLSISASFAYTFKETENLTKDLILGTYNHIEGTVTINGNDFAISTNNSKGIVLDRTTNLTINNLGSFSENSVIADADLSQMAKKYEDGKIKDVVLNINHNGANNFQDGTEPFISTSNTLPRTKLEINNSVVHNNGYFGTSTSAMQGGAIKIISNRDYSSDRDESLNESVEDAKNHGLSITNSYFTENKLEAKGGTIGGGAIFTQFNHGALNIVKSYFTNNYVKQSDTPTSGSYIQGGAIKNISARFNISNTYFGRNKAQGYSASGGAIYDSAAAYTSVPSAKDAFEARELNNVIFEENQAIASGTGASAGAMYGEGSVNINDSYFTKNSAIVNVDASKTTGANAIGGALYQTGAESIKTIKNTTFDGNKIELANGKLASGGAIYQSGNNSKSTVENSVFTNNSITADGGTSARGGALSQYGEKLDSTISNTIFENNSITNNSNLSKSNSEEFETAGGALYFEATPSNGSSSTSDMKIGYLRLNDVSFKGNSVLGNNLAAGGALVIADHGSWTRPVVTNIQNGLFENNSATSSATQITSQSGRIGAMGGAVYNGYYNVLNIKDSLFKGNSSTSASQEGKISYGGGAVYNETNGIATFVDTDFINNSAIGEDASGGAIYNNTSATANIIAMNKDVLFDGNKAGANKDSINSNAIWSQTSGVVNLNAAKDKKIIFNDSIASAAPKTSYGRLYYAKLNINQEGKYSQYNSEYNTSEKLPDYAPHGENAGTIVLNADMEDFQGDIGLYGGTVQVGQNGTFFNNAHSVTVNNATDLDVANGVIQQQNFGEFTLNAPLNVAIDADLEQGKLDSFSASKITVNNDAKINIKRVNVIADARAELVDIALDDYDNITDIITLDESAKTALGKVYKYDVNLDEDKETLSFTRKGFAPEQKPGTGGNKPAYSDINPAVMSGAVATQVGYMSQLNSYENAFHNTISRMMRPRLSRNTSTLDNRYAINESNSMKAKLHYHEVETSDWFRPYTSFESVDFKGGDKVTNIMYGSYFGSDGRLVELKNGKKAQLSGYLGYNGSHQTFDGNSMYQNGANLGITGSLYKDNFFTALTLNSGASFVSSSTMFGNDSFPMLMAGVASKSGYNVEFKDGKFVLQPNLTVSYSFVNAFDYTNAAGVKISSDPLNAIQVSPGLRFFANTKSGWQPYAAFNLRWNIMDKTDFKAANISLPQLSIKPYVEYGLGIQKGYKDTVYGYFQTLIRNGGRNGLALSLGLDVLLGKKHKENL